MFYHHTIPLYSTVEIRYIRYPFSFLLFSSTPRRTRRKTFPPRSCISLPPRHPSTPPPSLPPFPVTSRQRCHRHLFSPPARRIRSYTQPLGVPTFATSIIRYARTTNVHFHIFFHHPHPHPHPHPRLRFGLCCVALCWKEENNERQRRRKKYERIRLLPPRRGSSPCP